MQWGLSAAGLSAAILGAAGRGAKDMAAWPGWGVSSVSNVLAAVAKARRGPTPPDRLLYALGASPA